MVMCKLELYITIPQIHMQTSGIDYSALVSAVGVCNRL